VPPTATGDALSRTLQRIESLADARCRLIVSATATVPEALETVIAQYLARNLRDVRRDSPAEALHGDLTILLEPGHLPTQGWIDQMAQAILADPECQAVAPLVLTGCDEADGIWSGKLALQCRKAANAWAMADDLPADPGSLPMMVRRSRATELLSVPLEALPTSVAKLRPILVFYCRLERKDRHCRNRRSSFLTAS
jgi:hypothetical protein